MTRSPERSQPAAKPVPPPPGASKAAASAAGSKYRFAIRRESYADLAGGRVLLGRPGSSAFPVRLAGELFQRCAARLAGNGIAPPYTLYDPCCGEGYLLTVIGFLHGGSLERILASDIDAEAVEMARRNLSLLTPAGLERRLREIRGLIDAYGKSSHRAALESGLRLQSRLAALPAALPAPCFRFDLAGEASLPETTRGVDILLSDLPYGRSSTWQGSTDPARAAWKLLDQVRAVLSPGAAVALVANKEQRVSHPDYRRVGTLTIGRRRITFLEQGRPRRCPPPAYEGES